MSATIRRLSDSVRISASVPVEERRKRILDIMLAVIILAVLATLANLATFVLVSSPYRYTDEFAKLVIGSSFAAAAFSGTALVNRYRPGTLPGALFVILLVVVFAISDTPEQVTQGRSLFYFTIPIVIAGAVMPPRATFLAALLCTLAVSLVSFSFGRWPGLPPILGFFILACVTWIWGRGLEEAAEARRKSEDRYRLLAESAKDVIWTLDMSLRFTYASPSIEELLGFAPEELLGAPLDEIMTHESALLAERFIRNSIASETVLERGRDKSLPLELEGCCKDGCPIWLEVSIGSVRNAAGESVGIHGVARDISDRRAAAKKLEEAVGRAEFYNDLMAHDLSNMHQAIALSLELLLEDTGVANSARPIVQDALSQTERSIELAGNVRKHARLCREPKNLIALDLAEPVGSAIRAVQASFPKRRVIVNNNVPPNRYHVMADEFAVDLFFNLLHNSVKADAHERVIIDISADISGKARLLTVHVDDRGHGIDNELREQLMSRQEGRVTGKGLGFLLVRKIAERYDGGVAIRNRIEGDSSQGTRISVQFALA